MSSSRFHPVEKVSEKCPCIHGTDDQDWNMNYKNSYPLIKEYTGLGAPEFDAPNLRLRYFGKPDRTHVFKTTLPGRPYAPPGSASLDRSRVPISLDAPKYGADSTGGSPWPLHNPFSPESPDPRGFQPSQSAWNEITYMADMSRMLALLMSAAALAVIYYVFVK
jgi:hypothetical protein